MVMIKTVSNAYLPPLSGHYEPLPLAWQITDSCSHMNYSLRHDIHQLYSATMNTSWRVSYRNEHMKLLYTKSDQRSIEVNTVYSDWQPAPSFSLEMLWMPHHWTTELHYLPIVSDSSYRSIHKQDSLQEFIRCPLNGSAADYALTIYDNWIS